MNGYVHGIKHLIECHCVLTLYKSKNNNNINTHKFPVYSKSKNGIIIPKFAKCNNCESLHWVYDYCKSELRGGKDQTLTTMTIDDIMISLPERLSNLLLKLDCDISIWEHCLDVIENERWEEIIVLNRDIIDENQHVKILKIQSENKFKIENKVINSTIILE